MDLESQTLENAKSIGAITATVEKLSTIVGYEVERAKEDRAGVKDMVLELKDLNNKITGIADVQKDQAQANKDITELRTRTDQLKEWKDKYDLSKMDSRIASLEKVNDTDAGIKKAVSTGADWFWKIFGPTISIIILAILAWYFTQGQQYTRTSQTFTTGMTHGPITGE